MIHTRLLVLYLMVLFRFYVKILCKGKLLTLKSLFIDGKVRLMKLLSVDPQNYDDAPREGIRRIIEQVLVG